VHLTDTPIIPYTDKINATLLESLEFDHSVPRKGAPYDA
jgi:hypothetical protein